ncbi:MAG: hypothetical protein ACUVQR_04995 [Thermogutta sp.]
MEDLQALVRRIHDSPWRLVLVATGGGIQGIAELFKIPGASQTVLEAVVPYSAPALAEWLHGKPDRACAETTARAMAMAAFLRARQLQQAMGNAAGTPLAGVSCTASLVTDRPKKGDHRVHIAIQRADVTRSMSLILTKGARTRSEEEQMASLLFLQAVASACDLEPDWTLPLLPNEALEHHLAEAPDAWQKLLLGECDVVPLGAPADWQRGRPPLLFPGAFNPLHVGHIRMAQIAEAKLGRPVEFEISLLNADKPPLDYLEIRRRVEQFSLQDRIWLTRLPTFVEKARRFPQATFVVGIDTLMRIADPRYYGHDSQRRDQAIIELAELKCRFLVFGRLCQDRFLNFDDVVIPDLLRSLCTAIPESEFREDICSTALRMQSS